jgi:hypothetical protein
MAELLGRKPIFPGKDYVQQLNLITQVCMHLKTTDLVHAGLNAVPCVRQPGVFWL